MIGSKIPQLFKANGGEVVIVSGGLKLVYPQVKGSLTIQVDLGRIRKLRPQVGQNTYDTADARFELRVVQSDTSLTGTIPVLWIYPKKPLFNRGMRAAAMAISFPDFCKASLSGQSR